MHPLETYLEELRALRSSGAVVKETSGYGALANLLNAVGQSLKPTQPSRGGLWQSKSSARTPHSLKPIGTPCLN